MEIVAALQRLGFAEYEAKAYVALVKHGTLNGYELAKASGVPRANVYGVLERLQARSAVVRLDEESSSPRYAAVAPGELLERLASEFRSSAEETSRALAALETPAPYEPVWNVAGYDGLIQAARAGLGAARGSLLIAVWPQEALALRGEAASAEQRGVAITTLCMAACEQECGGCRGRIYRYAAGGDRAPRRLIVVPDGEEVIAGDITGAEETRSVRTRQPLMIQICENAVRASIALAATVADLGDRLDDVLAPETRRAIAAAAPGRDPSTAIARMRALRTNENAAREHPDSADQPVLLSAEDAVAMSNTIGDCTGA